ncbi:hypothetical protein GCM10010919_19270 [Alishewanella longhuensis]|uniref:Uncharacterized protein n=1 Tax=Alishewanella longhuensis TaxID=1091037 RepID=A0ABQ3KXZ0_9ALTE|nr:hypothetical protein [Alishewanella longhuensis]GHG69374.1 hypothetical protein GCM10010919_19270 [Alishewanella longhuensis]
MSQSVDSTPLSQGSLGKHEHQIPKVDVDVTLHNFFHQRQQCIDTLKTISPAKSALQIPGPVRELLAQLDSNPIILRKIEKRFVISGDIAAKTLPQLHQLDNLTQLWVKMQLALALLAEFEQRADLNSLNSALRVTDTICQHAVKQPLPAEMHQDMTTLLQTERIAISRLQHD